MLLSPKRRTRDYSLKFLRCEASQRTFLCISELEITGQITVYISTLYSGANSENSCVSRSRACSVTGYWACSLPSISKLPYRGYYAYLLHLFCSWLTYFTQYIAGLIRAWQLTVSINSSRLTRPSSKHGRAKNCTRKHMDDQLMRKQHIQLLNAEKHKHIRQLSTIQNQHTLNCYL